MEIYIALCHDHHIDPEVRVFASRDLAIAQARLFVDENAGYPDQIEEDTSPNQELYISYSEEGDYVRVTKGVLYI